MMKNLPTFRISISTLMVGFVAALSLTGCEFLGFGDDDDSVTIIDNNDTTNNDTDNNNNDTNNNNNDTNNNNTSNTNNITPDSETELFTLFDEEVDLTDGYSDMITIDVPDEIFSLAISISEGTANNQYTVTDWTNNDDFEVVRSGWETETVSQFGQEAPKQMCYPDCNTRVLKSVGAVGNLAPNNPDSIIEPGTHEFRIYAESIGFGGVGSSARVTVHAKTLKNDVPETGTVDINFFFSGANDWSAANAESRADFDAMVEEVDTLYDQVGIDIGEISFHDVDEGFQVIEDMSTGTGDMAQLFAHSSEGELSGPSIFFVDEIRMPFGGGGGGGILGISGGIPGPMIVNGTPRSGVAIATDSIEMAPGTSIAHVVAHELGHYLGLFHTSENQQQEGSAGHDPLPDTPENDMSYLMHAAGSGDNMSEWQGRVIRNNPWVY